MKMKMVCAAVITILLCNMFQGAFALGENRVLGTCSFESAAIGQAPNTSHGAGFTTISALNDAAQGSFVTVEEDSGNKVARIRAVRAGGLPAMATTLTGFSRSFEGNTRLDFKFKFANMKVAIPISFYDSAAGKSINFLKIGHNNLIDFGAQTSIPYTMNVGTWYSVSIFINSSANAASLQINDRQVGNTDSLLIGVSSINYSSLMLNIATWNWTDNTTADVYLDDVKMYDSNYAPVITLNGGTVTLHEGEAYTDPGFTANDPVDGNITAKVVVGGDVVNTNAAGLYTVSYNATANDGMRAIPKYRTVTVLTTPKYTKRVVKQYHFEDGTAGQLPTGFAASNDPSKGKYVTVENDTGNSGNKLLRLRAVKEPGTGTVDPACSLTGSYASDVTIDFRFKYENNKAQTPIILNIPSPNKDITFAQIKTNNTIDFAGQNYPCSLALNTWHTASITINSATNMVSMNINGQAIGAPVSLLTVGSVASINYSNLSLRFIIWNWGATGSIADLCIDDLTVSARPLITLSGSEKIILNKGAAYTEAGCSAVDLLDGDVTSKVTVGGDTLNTGVPGTYAVAYDVMAADGTMADRKYRKIIVLEDPGKEAMLGVTSQFYKNSVIADNVVTTVQDGNIIAKMSLTNYQTTADSVILYMALYENNCLQRLSASNPITIQSGEISDNQISINNVVKASGSQYKIKVFVWSGQNNLKPKGVDTILQ